MISARPNAQTTIIKRPRLTKQLDESEARIILLCAPAGYGKTTLAREWVETLPGPVAWYSGRATDSDPAAFAAGLAESAGAQVATDGELEMRIRTLAAQGQPPVALARMLASAVSDARLLLVLDDYHHAGASPLSDRLFQELAYRAPIRYVVTTRRKPDWATARSQAYGEMLVLGSEELAFTVDEAHAALGDKNQSAAEVVSAARGWPAVIGMAVANRQKQPMPMRLEPEELYEYFAENLFERAEPHLQDALLQLAVGADAHATTTRQCLGGNWRALVDRASVDGFLTFDTSGELRMHPLLREFFRARLRGQGQKRIDEIATPVITTLVDNARWDDALVALQDFPSAPLIASALEASLSELLAGGRIATVSEWIDLARSNRVDHPAVLLAEAALALAEGRHEHSQVLAAHAAVTFESTEAQARAYLTAARAAHLSEAVSTATIHALRAHELTHDQKTKIEALWIAFASALESQDPEVGRYLDALEQLGGSDPTLGLRLVFARALRSHEYGRTQEGLRACASAEALLEHVRDPLVITGFLNVYAHLSYCSGQYERALALADSLESEAQRAGLDFAIEYALVTRASALVGIRKLVAARKLLSALDRGDGTSAHVTAMAIICTAKMHIAAGELDRASASLDVEAPSASRDPMLAELSAYRGLVHASLRQTELAEAEFERSESLSGYVESAATVKLGRAILAATVGHEDYEQVAVQAVGSAFDVGTVDPIVSASRAFPQLVAACARTPDLVRKLTSLLTNSRDIDLGRQAGLPMARETRRREGLSPREQEVCELIVQGLSNRDISRVLFISESTTKVHLRHIFEKMGVRSRTELAALRTEE